MSEQYGEDYFLRGRATGKSLYEDYRWLPDLTVPMARRMVEHLGVGPGDTVLDFGCARGYTVKALRMLGVQAFGEDISEWAVANADPEAAPYINAKSGPFDWVIAKDVLEHVPYVSGVVRDLMGTARRGMLAVVPLSAFDGNPYVIDDYEKDVTHIQRWTLPTWAKMFMDPVWRVEAAYRLPGVKDNWWRSGWERGNGFITARRVA